MGHLRLPNRTGSFIMTTLYFKVCEIRAPFFRPSTSPFFRRISTLQREVVATFDLVFWNWLPWRKGALSGLQSRFQSQVALNRYDFEGLVLRVYLSGLQPRLLSASEGVVFEREYSETLQIQLILWMDRCQQPFDIRLLRVPRDRYLDKNDCPPAFQVTHTAVCRQRMA